MRPQTMVSATPGRWEMERTHSIFISSSYRPTSLINPPVIIRQVKPHEDHQMTQVPQRSP